MLSARDCLYGELVIILDSSDLFDFFFSVREGSFIIIEKLMWSTGGSSGTGGSSYASGSSGTGGSCEGTGVVSSGGTGVVSSGGTGVVSSWFALCLAVSTGESKVLSDVGSTTQGSSKKSDEGKISLLNGTMPVHRNQETAFSMVADFK